VKASKKEFNDLVEKLSFPKKIHFKDLARHITGFSTPIFGISWNPSKSEREIIKQLIVFLEDRRVLYAPFEIEVAPWITKSILKIREEITNKLQQLDTNSKAVGSLRAMRAACRDYLDAIELMKRLEKRLSEDFTNSSIKSLEKRLSEDFTNNSQEETREIMDIVSDRTQLGYLRVVFGLHIANLCSMYGIDLEGPIIRILPPAEKEEID
jgi:hypothetical protein